MKAATDHAQAKSQGVDKAFGKFDGRLKKLEKMLNEAQSPVSAWFRAATARFRAGIEGFPAISSAQQVSTKSTKWKQEVIGGLAKSEKDTCAAEPDLLLKNILIP